MFYTDAFPEGIPLPNPKENEGSSQHYKPDALGLLLETILGQLERLGNSL